MRGNMSRGLESFSRRGFANVVSICVISCCKNSLAFVSIFPFEHMLRRIPQVSFFPHLLHLTSFHFYSVSFLAEHTATRPARSHSSPFPPLCFNLHSFRMSSASSTSARNFYTILCTTSEEKSRCMAIRHQVSSSLSSS